MAAKKIRYLMDKQHDGRYVRAFHEGRTVIVVQVWNGEKPEGDPDGDWAMPSLLGLASCVAQAILQTPKALRWLMGYIEYGEGQVVRLSQDDATKTFAVSAGKALVWDESFYGLLDKLAEQMDADPERS